MTLIDLEGHFSSESVAVDNPNAVVVGLAPSQFHYSQLNEAFRLLLDGAQLVAIHKGKYYRQSDGLSLGPGAFVTALEYATGTNATVIGKPETAFFHEALKLVEVAPERAVMIGDDVRDDVQGAMDAGLMAILVQTGKYRRGDEDSIPRPPTAVCTDFAVAVEHILTWQ